jgi:hypothetical protein
MKERGKSVLQMLGIKIRPGIENLSLGNCCPHLEEYFDCVYEGEWEPRIANPSLVKSRSRAGVQAPENQSVKRLMCVSHPWWDVERTNCFACRVFFDAMFTVSTIDIPDESAVGISCPVRKPLQSLLRDDVVGPS